MRAIFGRIKGKMVSTNVLRNSRGRQNLKNNEDIHRSPDILLEEHEEWIKAKEFKEINDINSSIQSYTNVLSWVKSTHGTHSYMNIIVLKCILSLQLEHIGDRKVLCNLGEELLDIAENSLMSQSPTTFYKETENIIRLLLDIKPKEINPLIDRFIIKLETYPGLENNTELKNILSYFYFDKAIILTRIGEYIKAEEYFEKSYIIIRDLGEYIVDKQFYYYTQGNLAIIRLWNYTLKLRQDGENKDSIILDIMQNHYADILNAKNMLIECLKYFENLENKEYSSPEIKYEVQNFLKALVDLESKECYLESNRSIIEIGKEEAEKQKAEKGFKNLNEGSEMDSQELFENIFNRIPKIHADIYLGILRNTINEPIILEQKIMKALQEMNLSEESRKHALTNKDSLLIFCTLFELAKLIQDVKFILSLGELVFGAPDIIGWPYCLYKCLFNLFNDSNREVKADTSLMKSNEIYENLIQSCPVEDKKGRAIIFQSEAHYLMQDDLEPLKAKCIF